MIDQDISTTDPLTIVVRGRDLRRSNIATLQIISSSNTGEDFMIEMEAGINRAGGEETIFAGIGTFTQDDDTVAAFSISYETRYRIRHISGVAVHVLLVG